MQFTFRILKHVSMVHLLSGLLFFVCVNCALINSSNKSYKYFSSVYVSCLLIKHEKNIFGGRQVMLFTQVEQLETCFSSDYASNRDNPLIFWGFFQRKNTYAVKSLLTTATAAIIEEFAGLDLSDLRTNTKHFRLFPLSPFCQIHRFISIIPLPVNINLIFMELIFSGSKVWNPLPSCK